MYPKPLLNSSWKLFSVNMSTLLTVIDVEDSENHFNCLRKDKNFVEMLITSEIEAGYLILHSKFPLFSSWLSRWDVPHNSSIVLYSIVLHAVKIKGETFCFVTYFHAILTLIPR